MAVKTKNYNLAKPGENETADIEVINANMDIIDEQMKPVNALNSSDGAKALAAAQGKVLEEKITAVNLGKVDKIAGKGLSTNDYTAAEKTKLAGIATGANKTVIANNLTTAAAGSALDAAQGRVLDGNISEVNSSLSEEIDERKSADTALKATLINENLLINGGFDIWQRGESEFNTIGYTADRWGLATQLTTSAYEVTKVFRNSDGTLKIKSEGDSYWGSIYQKLENASKFIGETFTFSIKAKGRGLLEMIIGRGHNINANMIKIEKIELTTDYKVYSITTVIDEAPDNLIFVRVSGIRTAFDCEIKWAKLELGDTATKFVPKDYGTELAKCQRYQMELIHSEYSRVGSGLALSETECYVDVPLPTTMRIIPTCVTKNISNLYLWKLENIMVTSIALISFSNNIITFDVKCAGGLVSGEMYTLQTAGAGIASLLLDANV